jgi:prophage regulatory protein
MIIISNTSPIQSGPLVLEGTSHPLSAYVAIARNTDGVRPEAAQGKGEHPHPEKKVAPSAMRDNRAGVQWDRPGLVPLPTLLCKLQLSRSQIYALIARGEFPKPLKIGRSARWDSQELDLWIQARIGARAATLAQDKGYL